LTGRLRHHAQDRLQLPAVGDWVAIDQSPRIVAVLPRKSAFVRKVASARTEPQVVAANIDRVFIVTSANSDFNPRRIERYVSAIWDSGASPVLVINKTDLGADVDQLLLSLGNAALGLPVARVSALERQGGDQLLCQLGPQLTVALVGSSGVGKSTIANWLLGSDSLETGATPLLVGDLLRREGRAAVPPPDPIAVPDPEPEEIVAREAHPEPEPEPEPEPDPEPLLDVQPARASAPRAPTPSTARRERGVVWGSRWAPGIPAQRKRGPVGSRHGSRDDAGRVLGGGHR